MASLSSTEGPPWHESLENRRCLSYTREMRRIWYYPHVTPHQAVAHPTGPINRYEAYRNIGMTVTLDEIYQRLYDVYGPQKWWPAETPFEVIVGAILVQNTAWSNAQLAIQQLRDANLLTPDRLYALPVEELEQLIRSAGYYRMKTRRLRNLLAHLFKHYDGSVDRFFNLDTETLRSELLSINGIGAETADSILLYAALRPVFVVDAYTNRVLKRHRWMDYDAEYEDIQSHFQSHLEADVSLYNEFHALFVRLGHLHCRKTPQCDKCPLEEWLPDGGICLPEE
jgi:endonuclease-3 related protein